LLRMEPGGGGGGCVMALHVKHTVQLSRRVSIGSWETGGSGAMLP